MNNKKSWLIRNAKLLKHDNLMDISILDGFITEVGVNLSSDRPVQKLDVGGRLVIPGFVDAHMHLDKAYALDNGMKPADSLGLAIKEFGEWSRSVTPEQVYTNARQAAEQALLHGTIALRTHVSLSKGVDWLEAHLRLREEMAPWLTIQLVVFPEIEKIEETSTQQLISKAMGLGADLIGGATVVAADQKRAVDTLFELAGKHDCSLDLHVDESDDPSHNSLEYIADRKIELGFEESVTVGHCCSLSAMDENASARIINKVAQANIHVITLPSCNMYLMGREDHGLVRRGLTRVREFIETGVNVAYASDNIRDAFNPFGKADMLQGALICSHALHMGGPADLKQTLEMGTINPAKIMDLPDYGLEPGCRASLVVLDDTDWGSAIAREAQRLYVFSSGQLVVQTKVEQSLLIKT